MGMGMDMGISAGASALGSGSTGAAGYYFQNKDASLANRHAREFASHVMHNQIQWQVKDLQKAGLNPLLAVSRGGPGLMNPGQKDITPAFDVDTDFGKAVSSAKSMSRAGEEKRQLDKQGEIIDAAADTARANAVRADNEAFISGNEASASVGLLDRQMNLYRAALEKNAAEVGLSSAQAVHMGKQNRLMDTQFPGQLYDAKVENSWLGKSSKWVRPATGAVGDLSGAVGGFLAGRAMRTRRESERAMNSAIESRGTSRGGASYQPGNEYFDSNTGEVKGYGN